MELSNFPSLKIERSFKLYSIHQRDKFLQYYPIFLNFHIKKWKKIESNDENVTLLLKSYYLLKSSIMYKIHKCVVIVQN